MGASGHWLTLTSTSVLLVLYVLVLPLDGIPSNLANVDWQTPLGAARLVHDKVVCMNPEFQRPRLLELDKESETHLALTMNRRKPNLRGERLEVAILHQTVMTTIPIGPAWADRPSEHEQLELRLPSLTGLSLTLVTLSED